MQAERPSGRTVQSGPRVPRNTLPAGGTILLLNGTSSAGKTSLAKALQAAPGAQYLHVQLNAFRDMEPAGYFGPAQAAAGHLRVAALCRAMHAAVAQFAAHGQDVIFDHVLSADAWRYLFEDFAHERLFLVRVHCPLDELVRRERARGDREPGLAASQAGGMHEGREYDFSVDTSRGSPSQCADAVRAWLEQAPAPAAFARMRAREGRLHEVLAAQPVPGHNFAP